MAANKIELLVGGVSYVTTKETGEKMPTLVKLFQEHKDKVSESEHAPRFLICFASFAWAWLQYPGIHFNIL